MNRAKAILGWNADLLNCRDFRVEDHLDGRGETVVWLVEGVPAPGPADIEAGWAAWSARQASVPGDPLVALALQLEAVCRALALPPEPAFQAVLETRVKVNSAEGDRHDRG